MLMDSCRQESGEREGEDMQQRARGCFQTLGRCGKDKAVVRGAHALPAELPGRPKVSLVLYARIDITRLEQSKAPLQWGSLMYCSGYTVYCGYIYIYIYGQNLLGGDIS